jgi:hypothetical protein
MRKIGAVYWTRFVDAAQISLQKHASAFITPQDPRARPIERCELFHELAFAGADKLGQLLNIFLRDADLGYTAAIGASRAIDLRFNLLAETAQPPIRVPVVPQISAKLGVLAPLLLFQPADLD